jgi:methylated-DNA-[protein]-cysteine S-methyltransferase
MPIIPSPLGNILINSREDCLAELRFTDEEVTGPFSDQVLLETQKQLDEYFAGTRRIFNIPIGLGGTDFQRKVWMAITELGFGQTTTYRKIADKIQNPAAIRAVGTAIGANPILIILPCHRIIGTSGQLTGYAGGLERKRRLLDLEGFASQGSLFG